MNIRAFSTDRKAASNLDTHYFAPAPTIEVNRSATLERIKAGASESLNIEAIVTAEQFSRLEKEWDELLSASNVNNLFLTWEWLHTWWKHLSARRKLHILAIRRGARLIALAPLALQFYAPRRAGLFRNAEFLGMGPAGSDYPDLIVRRGEEGSVMNMLAERLDTKRYTLVFQRIGDGPSATARLAAQLKNRGWSVTEAGVDASPYIWLRGRSWGAYVAGLGPSHRRNLRRRLRCLETDFAVSFDEVKTETERRQYLDDFKQLHHKRWAGGSNALNSKSLHRFHDEFSALAFRRGWLRLYLMRLNARPVAAVYGFSYGGVFYYYQAGFDPEFSGYSVGLVALGLAIRNAIKEGVHEFDLLHGAENYKFLWTPYQRKLVTLQCYPPGVLGSVNRASGHARNGVIAARARLGLNPNRRRSRHAHRIRGDR
jgi:CelD/BcsL family acetyltransferase involved in cellulose biosynthesis